VVGSSGKNTPMTAMPRKTKPSKRNTLTLDQAEVKGSRIIIASGAQMALVMLPKSGSNTLDPTPLFLMNLAVLKKFSL
jgi:hypothetical protein